MKFKNILAFNLFIQKISQQELPLQLAYKIVKNKNLIKSEVDFYYEQLNKNLEKFAEKDDEGKFVPSSDGNGIQLIQGKELECQMAIQELEDIDIDINIIPLSLEEFSTIGSITLNDMDLLMPFIKEE